MHSRNGAGNLSGDGGVELDCGASSGSAREPFVREENQRGFKLRVRFVSAKQVLIERALLKTDGNALATTSELAETVRYDSSAHFDSL